MAGISDSIRDRVDDELRRTLRVEAEDLLGRATRDAPIEEGTLRGSGEVEIRETATGAEAVVSFNTPYAARQHEELEYEHPRGGKPKYLEDHVKGMVRFHPSIMAAAMRRALRGS